MMSYQHLTKKIGRALLALFFALFILIILFPFIWMLLGSFKTVRELFAIPLSFWPEQWQFVNYRDALTSQPFAIYVANSLIVSSLATIMVIFSGSLASYSLARTGIIGKKFILILVLTVSLLPPVTLINPIYQMLGNLGLLNSHIGLSLILAAVEMPTAIWLLTSFFQSIPFELEESAMLDGASVIGTYARIVLPLVSPGLFTVSIFTFITAWNNYIFSAVLNQRPLSRTVPVALTLFETESYTPWHLICAAAIIVSLPLVLIVMLMQRRIISGMIDGSVKG